MSNLLRNNLVVAAGTALSRVTGLARVAVFALVIGQTALADAYHGANSAPNAIYELLIGGVLSASLVPMFTRHALARDREATSAVVTVSVVSMTALTALAVLSAPLIFRLFSVTVAPEVDADQYRQVGTVLTRIFLIQILFYGLTAIGSALLQARRRFFAAAWSPVLSNLVIIASLLLVGAHLDGRSPELGEVLVDGRLQWLLGLGATAGIAVMAIALLPAMRRADIGVRWLFDPRHPEVRRLVRMSAWSFGYVLANQVALIVIQNLAGPGSGDLDAYAKAYVFFVLPHGLLAMSIVTTFTPDLATAVSERNAQRFAAQMATGLRLIAVLVIPASVVLFVLRRPIVGLALEHGNFDAAAALATSRALAGFALGLLGFSLYLFVLRGFYAHGDTRTPFTINLAENVLNIVLAVLLGARYGVLGLGAGFAIAYLVSAVWALYVLQNKVPRCRARDMLRSIAPMLLAGVVMAEVVWFAARLVGGNTGLDALVRTVVAGTIGVVCYAAILRVLRVPEATRIAGLARRLTR